jgi:pimeloyl-ACP methyl ester carboxylesterase
MTPADCRRVAMAACIAAVAGLLAPFARATDSAPDLAEHGGTKGPRVEFELVQRGSHVSVIFENGLGGQFDWWAKVVPAIAGDTTVFAYNRPGYGRSAAASTPRDGRHVVEELRRTLRQLQVRPPYVLVGHSLGGLYMQMFARLHPAEVAGLVLVDATNPEAFIGDPSTWPAWYASSLPAASPAERGEMLTLGETGRETLKHPLPTTIPVIVLSATNPDETDPALAARARARRLAVAQLYTQARQVWVESGHGIPLEQPAAVIEAIRSMIGLERSAQAPSGKETP